MRIDQTLNHLVRLLYHVTRTCRNKMLFTVWIKKNLALPTFNHEFYISHSIIEYRTKRRMYWFYDGVPFVCFCPWSHFRMPRQVARFFRAAFSSHIGALFDTVINFSTFPEIFIKQNGNSQNDQTYWFWIRRIWFLYIFLT